LIELTRCIWSSRGVCKLGVIRIMDDIGEVSDIGDDNELNPNEGWTCNCCSELLVSFCLIVNCYNEIKLEFCIGTIATGNDNPTLDSEVDNIIDMKGIDCSLDVSFDNKNDIYFLLVCFL